MDAPKSFRFKLMAAGKKARKETDEGEESSRGAGKAVCTNIHRRTNG